MPNKESLERLLVLDRLEVGPVRLKPKGLDAPYRVVQGDQTHECTLEYRYQESVFEPEAPAARNLASMIAAQVALNYGLFCREIVFRGEFDRLDRRFLEEMAVNTAREIYVKKFLEPNPYLHNGPDLAVEKRKSYLLSQLVFDEAEPEVGAAEFAPGWHGSPARHCVLSSGGKDSLLSYGLLTEMGLETHPVFVNESGRHWFTALNAHRWFKRRNPHTSRVWTNSDRVFAWMLRRLPFIRPDFADVRADEYAIRLWTVAVFLFGALPLMRKRGIGRLIIGNEFDSTWRATREGIPHYNGLYDQSVYFDHALTRYFHRKSWNIQQFSVLRPLSEFLIQKTLAQRYGHLQAVQVSCHAAHTEEGLVRPCGRCEKCRRIVSMLKAAGVDPRRCGYGESQIEPCLRSFLEQGANQEAAGVRHLTYLLTQAGCRIPAGGGRGQEHPEVEKLRFDAEHSPVDCVPVDLRGGLYAIFLDYARGAVIRKERQWTDYDPIHDERAGRPYLAGVKTASPGKGRSLQAAATHLLGELTWPQAKERLKEVDLALLPVGAVEQHGPHLPLDTDAFDAEYLAGQVAESCTRPRPLVLPLVPYGVSYHHEDFPGTISVTNEALFGLIYDIGMSAAHNGIRKLIIINGHGGNAPTLKFAAQMINRDAGIFTCVDSGETSDADIDLIAESHNDVHAGEIETSTSMAIRPHLVRTVKSEKYAPRFSSRYLDFSSTRGVEWFARTSKISASGVLGDPSKASREKGVRMWEVMIKNLVEFVEHLKDLSLDEIYERRY